MWLINWIGLIASNIMMTTHDLPDSIMDIYKNILKRDVDESDDGHKYWMQEISKGADRASVLNYFKQVATDTNQKENKIDFEKLYNQKIN